MSGSNNSAKDDWKSYRKEDLNDEDDFVGIEKKL